MTTALPVEVPARCQLRAFHIDGAYAPIDAIQILHTARSFPPHFFGTYTISVVESGTSRLSTKDGSWLATPGAVIVLAPGELHTAEVISAEPYGYRSAYLQPDVAHDVILGRGPGGGTPTLGVHRAVLPPSAAGIAFRAAHRGLAMDPADVHAESRLLHAMRALVQEATTGADAAVTPADAALVADAQAFLGEHIAHRVSLRDVAARFGISPFRLIRVFGRVTGLSPYAWLVLLRVNQARRLLEAGAPVSDATYRCGFSDQSHLTRTFRRTFGVPPGQYARAARAVANSSRVGGHVAAR